MFQTIYTNKKRGFSQEVTPTAEFMRQYEGMCRDYPLMVYPTEMGIKQAIPDSMAGVTDEATFCAKILKKADAVFAGTVRVAGTGERQPSKTPIEREIWRLAAAEMVPVFAKNKKNGNEVPKAREAYYIGLYIDRERERLTELASTTVSIGANAEDDLDELFAVMEDEDEAEAAE